MDSIPNNNISTLFFLWIRCFRRDLGLTWWHKDFHFNEHAMTRCLPKCTEHLLHALCQQFSPPCQLFYSVAWQLSNSLGFTQLHCLQWYSLYFAVGFFVPLFSPARYFCVRTLNIFYASVTLTHPSGCRIWYFFKKQAFVLKCALNFLLLSCC